MTGPVMYVHLPTRKPGFRYDGTNAHEIALWADGKAYVTDLGDLVIRTRQGDFTANIGDVVMRGSEGEYYPCPDPIHAVEYAVAGEPA